LANLGATGLWSFDVEYSGANQTHRFSGGKGAGGNPQNFQRCQDPEEHKKGHACKGMLRKAVCAPAGYKLIVGDFAAIEFRLVAYLSKDPGLMELIENNVDPYCDFASVYYGRTITKKDDAERRFGKEAQLGLGYGMGYKKFQARVKIKLGRTISDEEAMRAVDLYRERYTRVPQLWYVLNSAIPFLTAENKHIVLGLPVTFEKEAIVLPSGLQMQYPNLRQEEGEKGPEWIYDIWDKGQLQRRKLYGGKVLENISQGLAGELCKEAAQHFGMKVTGLVHDEIHLLERTPFALLAKKKLERVMTKTPDWMPRIKLKAEVGIGPNWLEAK
jgi:DNA polymerase